MTALPLAAASSRLRRMIRILLRCHCWRWPCRPAVSTCAMRCRCRQSSARCASSPTIRTARWPNRWPQALERAGAAPAAERRDKVATLQILSERWGNTPLSVDAFGRSQEYTLRYAVVFEMRAADDTHPGAAAGDRTDPRLHLGADAIRSAPTANARSSPRNCGAKWCRRSCAASTPRPARRCRRADIATPPARALTGRSPGHGPEAGPAGHAARGRAAAAGLPGRRPGAAAGARSRRCDARRRARAGRRRARGVRRRGRARTRLGRTRSDASAHRACSPAGAWSNCACRPASPASKARSSSPSSAPIRPPT